MKAPMKAWQPVVWPLLLASTLAMGQKREDILSIQRDVAQLQDQIKQMQTSQDQKMAALDGLLRQTLEESGKAAAAMAALQQNLSERLNEQQTKLVAPIAVLGTKVDQSGDELRSLRENVADLSTRLGNMDSKLADISSAVRTLSTPQAAPPPAPGAAGSTPPPPVAPAGVSAETLYQNATRDFTTGKEDLAMSEFTDYLKYFPQTENAPAAQYYIGLLYDRAKQYEDAVQAFDAVLERYPDNPKTPEAMYYKAVDLMKGNHKADAAAEFKEFLQRFPTHNLARNANTRLSELKQSTTPSAPRNRKK